MQIYGTICSFVVFVGDAELIVSEDAKHRHARSPVGAVERIASASKLLKKFYTSLVRQLVVEHDRSCPS